MTSISPMIGIYLILETGELSFFRRGKDSTKDKVMEEGGNKRECVRLEGTEGVINGPGKGRDGFRDEN